MLVDLEAKNMKILIFRITIISIFISLCVFLIGQQQVQAQTEKTLNFNEILSALKSTSRINKSIKEVNEKLITDVVNRGVSFELTLKNKNSLRNNGSSDLLIKVISEYSPNYLKDKTILYQKYVDNYNGTVKQKRIAVEVAREFIKRYSNDVGDKEVIKYFKTAIPDLEKLIATIEGEDCR